MKPIIIRLYELLLADPTKDADYTEGNEVNGYRVFGSALEMADRFSGAFNKKPIGSPCNLLTGPSIWHVDNCTIRYDTKRDKEIPNNPLCFGYLTVVGSRPNIDKVNKILTDSFSRIDDLVKDCEY
ncbi:MAG: hypothetical protein Q7J54_07475 [Candidatus Woesearchaeota archaeon]|nr:hypothetical protein [Candidatus Woesearchaeota archaeon]